MGSNRVDMQISSNDGAWGAPSLLRLNDIAPGCNQLDYEECLMMTYISMKVPKRC